MSNPASISGVDLTTPQGRQILQDALDILYGLIQKAGGVAAGPTTFDELRVRMLTVLGTINVVPEDKPPANVNSRLVTPWLTGQRGRGEVWRFEDQNDGGDLLEVRSQPYLIGTPTATSGDWEFRFTSAQRDPAGAYRSLGAIRFSSSGRIRTYDASETLLFDSSLALTASTAPLPTRFVSGLAITYASSSTITVASGKARDKADGANMSLSSQVTVSTATANAALGYERKALTGTHTFNFGAGTVSGNGSAYLTEFGGRALTGTFSNTGALVTGTLTRFLSEVAVNDLIGVANTTNCLWRVVSIESNTSLTLATYPSAFGKTDFSGTTGVVVEQPVIESAAGKAHGVGFITSNTALTMNYATGSATETNVAGYASSKALLDSTFYTCLWRAVWLLSGGSGTTVALSTQRTTPYLSITGYTTSYRRIGWVRVNSSGNLVSWSTNLTRGYTRYTSGSAVVIRTNADTPAATSTDSFTCEAAAPPTAKCLQATLASNSPNTATDVAGAFRGTFNTQITVKGLSTSTSNGVCGWVDCDGAQGVSLYATAATGDGTGFTVTGWEEELE